MMIKSHTNKAPTISIITMTTAQLFLYLTGLVWLYFLITLNWAALIIGLIFIVVQIPFSGRNQKFVDFFVKYAKPNLFYNVIRVYEEDIAEDEKTLFCFCPHSVFCLGNNFFKVGMLLNMNHPM